MRITIKYYAALRENRGVAEEILETKSVNVTELYAELKAKYNFKLSKDLLRVAVNNQFCSWEQKLQPEDTVIFIPPVAGG